MFYCFFSLFFFLRLWFQLVQNFCTDVSCCWWTLDGIHFSKSSPHPNVRGDQMISQTVEDVHQVPVRPLVPSEWILRSSFISSSYSYSLRPLASLSQHRTARSNFIAVSIRELTHCFIVKICRSISVVSHQLLSRKTDKYVHGKFHPLWLFELNKNFSLGIWSHFVQRCGDNVVGFTCRAAKGFIFENTVTWTWTGAVIRNCNWCLVTRSEVTLLWSVMSFHPEKQTWSHCCGDFFFVCLVWCSTGSQL